MTNQAPPVAAYRNFDLELTRQDGRIGARVLRSPEGEEDAVAETFVDLPPSLDALPALAGLDAQIGQRLLPGAVGERWAASLATAEQAGEGVRLRLYLRDPALADIPWEAARVRDQWLALRPQTPLVRYVPAARAPGALQAESPLRLLVLISAATEAGLPALDAAAERAALTTALQPLVAEGELALDWLEGAITRGGLLDALRQRRPHILHYIGHGAYNAANAEGSLVFAKTDARGRDELDLVGAAELGVMLDGSGVRLALLNACQTGRAAGGVAWALVKAALPAAIGMQSDVPDDAAIAFAGAFYRALVDGWPVDAAVVEGRRQIAAQAGLDAPWWALPVLYMRTPDGVLWQRENKKEGNMGQETPKAWWESIVPPAPGQVSGDIIIAQVGAGARNVAVGKGISQTIGESLGPPVPNDRQVIEGKLAAVEDKLRAARGQIDASVSAMADFQLKLLAGELTKLGADEVPSASTITQVGEWLFETLPILRPTLIDLFAQPAAGRALAKAGDAAVQWARQRLGSASP